MKLASIFTMQLTASSANYHSLMLLKHLEISDRKSGSKADIKDCYSSFSSELVQTNMGKLAKKALGICQSCSKQFTRYYL